MRQIRRDEDHDRDAVRSLHSLILTLIETAAHGGNDPWRSALPPIEVVRTLFEKRLG